MSWTIAITVKDDKDTKRTVKMYADESLDFFEVQLWTYEYVNLLDQLINGQIVSANITRTVQADPVAPLPSASVSEKAAFSFTTHAASVYKHQIPTWNEVYTRPIPQTQKRRIDTRSADVETLVNLMTDGAANGHPFSACDSRGAELFTVRGEQRYVFRRSKK
jgi:hypothetical protein